MLRHTLCDLVNPKPKGSTWTMQVQFTEFGRQRKYFMHRNITKLFFDLLRKSCAACDTAGSDFPKVSSPNVSRVVLLFGQFQKTRNPGLDHYM